MADGYLSDYRLKIGLSSVDKSHLNNFVKYIGHGNVIDEKVNNDWGQFDSSYVSIMDSDNIPKIKELFNITGKKTYSPIDIKRISEEDLIPFFIGYIDGDGSISNQTNRKDCSIRLHIHSSWLPVLVEISNRLSKIIKCELTKPKITKNGYCSWQLTNSQVVTYLKKGAIKLDLPILNRKWGKIDENFVSRYTTSRENLKNVKVLLENGYKNKEICEELGLKPSTVSNMIKRNNLSYR